ncbi:gluconate transporter, partial [Streptomyces sp. SID13588]|nr:gluconate transporter [Streptomyces sp. SID13588]
PADLTQRVFDVIGNPMFALLVACLLGLFTLGRAAGFTRDRLSETVEKSLMPIAGVLLIVAAGGGFKQVLVDAGVGQMILDISKDWSVPALLLAWLIAVIIRLATGSATVATVSAAGLASGLADGMSTTHVALMVL